MSKLIYLDNAATTKTAPEVVEAMLPYFTEYYGNPSSVYSFAAQNKEVITQQREIIANALGAKTESILLGADDHIRMQFLAPGLCLEKLWQKADAADDRINEHFPYAYDEKYGYLTTFPTNMGTGLKACVVIHLPMLSQLKKFQGIVADMGRLGTSIRGLFGEGSENAGNMYELSNQRTLGLSEREIIELVNKAAVQLNSQEQKVRKAALNARKLEREDETYKSYGVLKYARKMAEKDARVFIGQLISGETDGLISFEKEESLYSLLVGIKPANLNLWASRPLDKEETDCVRAAYIREHLPQICS